jgi:hypothetical protein
MDMADIERLVTKSIADDPRSTYFMLIRLAQTWGECAYELDMTLEDLDKENAAMDEGFDFVPKPIRDIVKTYTLIGYKVADGTLPQS